MESHAQTAYTGPVGIWDIVTATLFGLSALIAIAVGMYQTKSYVGRKCYKKSEERTELLQVDNVIELL